MTISTPREDVIWADVFAGRARELDAVKVAWGQVSGESPDPQVVVLLAEPGLGKTRLAQELYHHVATHFGDQDRPCYWPEHLDRRGNNLALNPDPAKCRSDNPMRFLWWGLRAEDGLTKGSLPGAAVGSALPTLRPHLEYLSRAARQAHLGDRRQRLLVNATKDALVTAADVFTFGLIGATRSAAKHVEELVDIHRTRQGLNDNESVGSVIKRERESLVDTIMTDMQRVMEAPLPGMSVMPVIIVVDDAQFIKNDPTLHELVVRLVRRSQKKRWPLLVLLTHWEREWHLDIAAPDSRLPLFLSRQLGADWAPVNLSKIEDLGEMIDVGLPGLTDSQRFFLLQKADGNPRLLDELLRHLRLRPRYFVNRDINASLAPAGEKEVENLKVDLYRLIEDRLRQAPAEVQGVVALASLQGMRFLERIALRALKVVSPLLGANERTVAIADRPYGFVKQQERGVAEFTQGVYRDAAADVLLDIANEDIARDAILSELQVASKSNPIFADLSATEQATARNVGISLLSGRTKSSEDRRLLARCIVASAQDAFDQHDHRRSAGLLERAALGVTEGELAKDSFTPDELTELLETRSEGGSPKAATILMDVLVDSIDERLHMNEAQYSRALHAIVSVKRDDTGWYSAEPYLQELLHVSESLHETQLSTESFEIRIEALKSLAEFEFAAGGWTSALPTLRELLLVAYEAHELEPSQKNRQNLLYSLRNKISGDSASGDKSGLEGALAKLLKLARDGAEASNELSDRRELAQCLLVAGLLSGESAHFDEGIAILREALIQMPTPRSRHALIYALRLSLNYAGSRALSRLQEALELARDLVDEVDSSQDRLELARLLGLQGDRYAKTHPELARESYGNAVEIYCDQMEEQRSSTTVESVMQIYERWARLESALGKSKEALAVRDSETEVAQQYLKRFGTPIARRTLVKARLRRSIASKLSRTEIPRKNVGASYSPSQKTSVPESPEGYWRLPKRGASEERLLDELHRDLKTLLGEPPPQLRTIIRDAAVPFYPGWQLFCLEFRFDFVETTLRSYILYNDGLAVPLDGSAEFIHLVSAAAPIDLNDETVIPYLRFFCDFVSDDNGEPFRIISAPSSIRGEGQHSLRDEFRPPQIVRVPSDDDDSWQVAAWVRYTGVLWRCQFSILPDGKVDMLDDTKIIENKAPQPLTWSLYEGWPSEEAANPPDREGRPTLRELAEENFSIGELATTENDQALLAELRALADFGERRADAVLGQLYLGGGAAPHDRTSAIEHLRRAAEAGDVKSMSLLGLLLYWGPKPQVNRQESRKWLRRARKKGKEFIGFSKADRGFWVILRLQEAGFPYDAPVSSIVAALNDVLYNYGIERDSSLQAEMAQDADRVRRELQDLTVPWLKWDPRARAFSCVPSYARILMSLPLTLAPGGLVGLRTFLKGLVSAAAGVDEDKCVVRLIEVFIVCWLHREVQVSHDEMLTIVPPEDIGLFKGAIERLLKRGAIVDDEDQ